MNSSDISFTPEDSQWQVSNVEEAINYIYNNYSTVDYYISTMSYDTDQAKVTYKAESDVRLLVTGTGASTVNRGTTNFVINTEGMTKELVNGKYMYSSSSSAAYSCVYAYIVELKEGQTLEAYTSSKQGYTSNTTVLYLLH